MSETCPVCRNELPPEAAACPYCGFKLLGSTQRFAPVALDDEPLAAKPAPAPSAQAELRVVRGPQTGVSFRLGDEPLSVGRSPQRDVFLNDMTVSREHALIEPVDGGHAVRDLNSFNGTWVNNDSVDAPRTLKNGDVIQIGAFCLVYQTE